MPMALDPRTASTRKRHRIENFFARLKVFRCIATRYEKLHASFAAMLTLACILVWLEF